jgi:uncharacterized protein (DUF924 family)
LISGANKQTPEPANDPGGDDPDLTGPSLADEFDMAASDGLTPVTTKKLIVDPLGEIDIAIRRDRYNVSAPEEYPDDDPMSAAYARPSIEETAGTILHFWFQNSAERPALISERNKFWFNGGFDIDKVIAHRFTNILAHLASGEARRWAAQGPRERLAAVIALDQFSRNIFRGEAAAFENDALARELTMEALALGIDRQLKPVERWFLYMPLEHSESATDQRRSVEQFGELLADAPPEARQTFASAYDYAKRHAAVIRRFGRFPHRNAVLGRTSNSAELAFLKKPGSRF